MNLRALSAARALLGFPAALFVVSSLLVSPATAQQAPSTPPPSDLPTATLHVYTNRIQVPTLVLQNGLDPIPQPDASLNRERFEISLDSGPLFHPSEIHIQGDESITLSLVLDLSSDLPRAESPLDKHLSQLARALHPQDRFSLYALDCNTIRSSYNVAASAEAVLQSLQTALATPGLHGKKNKPSCNSSLRLWDTVYAAIWDLGRLPGHHAVLVLSPGVDVKSQNRIIDLINLASTNNVSIFGIRHMVPLANIYDRASQRQVRPARESAFWDLCVRSGGYLYTVRPELLDATLQSIVTDLRSRYILEFPRPDNYTSGAHTIQVTILGSRNDMPLPAGAYVPVADPSVLSDPSTVRNAPTPDQLGPRHAVSPK